MSYRSAVIIVLMLLLPGIGHAERSMLKFVKQIGVGWSADKYGWMSFVSFSADGRMIASDAAAAPDDVSGDLTVWSFPGGKLVKRLAVKPASVSRNWQYYADFHGVGSLESGTPLLTAGDDVYAVHAFSPDSRYVAVSSPGQDDAQIRVARLDDGKQVSAFGKYSAFSMAISPDGRTLASGHWGLVTLWDMLTGRRLAVLRGFGRYVEGLSFSRDGRLLAAGTDTGGLQIWDVRHRKRLHTLEIGGGQVSDPAFSPDGRLVAIGIYGTGAVWLIDTRSGALLDHRKVSDIGCGSVAFSPDGRFLITPSTGGLITWPYDRGGTIRVFAVKAARQ
jgi:WD40 repeat protein